MYSQFVVAGWPQTVHMYSQFIVVGWPQTVHVSPVLHAVATCALLAQLVLKEPEKILFLPPMRGNHPGILFPSRLLDAVASEAQRAQVVSILPQS